MLNSMTWIDVVLNFLVGLIYAFIVSLIYRQCRGVHANRSFIQTLYMLTMVITLVIMVIMSVRGTTGVAVAFGLLGALSIIRFRTIVKDNRDTAYIFLAVACGLASGTGMWWIGFTGLVVIGTTLLLMEHAPWHHGRQRVIIKIAYRPGSGDDSPDLANILKQFGTRIDMMHVRTVRLGELLEMTYSITLFPRVNVSYAVQELLRVNGVDGVNMFNIDELDEL